jgi:hypothetical protein
MPSEKKTRTCPRTRARTHTHTLSLSLWKLDNHCKMQLLRRLASLVSWEWSCLVFHEWYGGCVVVFSVWTAQTSSTCSTWSGRYSLQLQFHCSFQFPCLKGSRLPVSPDLSCIDFFLWGHQKGKVHMMNPHSLQEIKANIRPQNCSNYTFTDAYSAHKHHKKDLSFHWCMRSFWTPFMTIKN